MDGETGKKKDWVDDGRVIAEMDVDGMPQSFLSAYRSRRALRRAGLQAVREKAARGETLTRKELRRYSFSAVLGGLAAVGILAGGLFLFILLWLRR